MLAEVLIDINTAPRAAAPSVIKTASAAEEDSVIAVITAAFINDPPSRWIYPNAQQYLECFPAFVQAFGGKAFETESAYYADDFKAASLWLPPGIEPDEEALVFLFQNTVAQNLQKDLFALFEQMGNYHPSEPHWYLPLIGADPAHQGKGLGAALLEHALAVCDGDGKLAYLESSNPRNVPLYERHGFELLGTIQVGSSPPIFPMLRAPR